jgi:single-stranded-DNA-specific exonuclease
MLWGMLPLATLQQRPIDAARYQQAIDYGLSPLAARIAAARPLAQTGFATAIAPRLADLSHYRGLAEIEKAAARIARAILDREIIAIETDHDVDGVTSHAILWLALTRYFHHPAELTLSFIGHRLQEGYGLSQGVCDRILAHPQRPSVIITADNGSSDEPRIAQLRSVGIDVIVTDHHEMPLAGPPPSAYACISPRHPANQYPDTAIAGCMVAWLLMAALRRELAHHHAITASAEIAELLDLVAVGTVADCVSLGESINNRAVVRHGLWRINQQLRPCWRQMQQLLKLSAPFTASDLAFGVGPRINARGRLDEAMAGVHFLLTDDDEECSDYAALLESENENRKAIEQELKQAAITAALPCFHAGDAGLVIWLAEGHAGVHGIVASRLVEAFGRPAICLSPKPGHSDLVTGSARGINGLHLRDALQWCAQQTPDHFVGFGGHAAAAGLTLQRSGIEHLRANFNHAIRLQMGEVAAEPILWSDGPLTAAMIDLATLEALDRLEPWGRGFEPPRFHARLKVNAITPLGKDQRHLRLQVDLDGSSQSAVWFNAIDRFLPPIQRGETIDCLISLRRNIWQGVTSPQLVIERRGRIAAGDA